MTDLLHRTTAVVERPTPGRRPRVRRLSALQVILVGMVAYGGAALLNAEHLHQLAARQPFGWRRDVTLMAASGLRWTSRTMHLDGPGHLVDRPESTPARPLAAAVMPTAASATTTATTSTARVRAIAPDPAPNAALPTDTAASVTTTTALPIPSALRVPTTMTPLAVWVGGDSIAQGVGSALGTLASHQHLLAVTAAGRISTGLARPDFFDWPGAVDHALTTARPEAVVVAFGANDPQPVQTADGTPVTFGTDAWRLDYRARVAAVMNRASPGRPMVWVGLPVAREATLETKFAFIDQIYRDEAARHPAVVYVDTRALFSPDGTFQAYRIAVDGRQHLVRAGDGVHFTGEGYDVIAAAIQAKLLALADPSAH